MAPTTVSRAVGQSVSQSVERKLTVRRTDPRVLGCFLFFQSVSVVVNRVSPRKTNGSSGSQRWDSTEIPHERCIPLFRQAGHFFSTHSLTRSLVRRLTQPSWPSELSRSVEAVPCSLLTSAGLSGAIHREEHFLCGIGCGTSGTAPVNVKMLGVSHTIVLTTPSSTAAPSWNIARNCGR